MCAADFTPIQVRRAEMAEVTYFVALPFVATDEGVALGEPVECFNPKATVMRAEALSRKEGCYSACNFGSDSLLMKFKRLLALVIVAPNHRSFRSNSPVARSARAA